MAHHIKSFPQIQKYSKAEFFFIKVLCNIIGKVKQVVDSGFVTLEPILVVMENMVYLKMVDLFYGHNFF